MKPIFDCELSADTFDNLKKSCDDRWCHERVEASKTL
jgi:hypothetical protein